MHARLLVVSGPDLGQAFSVKEGETLVIGRADTVQVRLSDPCVSRTHCRRNMAQGRVRVTDTGSRSGTLVNGQPITQCELQPGDVLRLAYTELRLDLETPDGVEPAEAEAPERHARPGVTVLLGLVGKKISRSSRSSRSWPRAARASSSAHRTRSGTAPWP